MFIIWDIFKRDKQKYRIIKLINSCLQIVKGVQALLKILLKIWKIEVLTMKNNIEKDIDI